MVDGRLDKRPPFLLPKRSATNVAPPIHMPAAAKERIVFNRNALSIYFNNKYNLFHLDFQAPGAKPNAALFLTLN
jgi:hypothetical protein